MSDNGGSGAASVEAAVVPLALDPLPPCFCLSDGSVLETHPSTLPKSAMWARVSDGEYHGAPVLVKVLENPTPEQMKEVNRIVRMSIDLYHPNIGQFLGVSWNPTTKIVMFVTELPGRGDLASLLVTEKDKPHSRGIMLDVARAMSYLHAQPKAVLHRDIRASNIHIGNDYKAKVVNFEFSGKHTLDKTLIGTPAWAAPEILRGKSDYDAKVDVYSFAMLMVEILNGEPPYTGEYTNARQLLNEIMSIHRRPRIQNRAALTSKSKALIDLIVECSWNDRTTRPGFPKIVECLVEILQDLRDKNTTGSVKETNPSTLPKSVMWTRVSDGEYHGAPVLVKVLENPTSEQMKEVNRIVRQSIDLDHANIGQFLGVSWDPTTKIVMFVTELPGRGDLASLLVTEKDKLTLERLVQIMLDVARAMSYLHAQPKAVLHRDIRASNIHIGNDYKAKVANFEFSGKHTLDKTLIGTPAWAAPEILLGKSNYDAKVDVYSFAMLMVEILNGEPPYTGEYTNARQLLHEIASKHRRPRIQNRAHWPSALLALLEKSWQNDATARPAFPNIVEALSSVLKSLEACHDVDDATSPAHSEGGTPKQQQCSGLSDNEGAAKDSQSHVVKATAAEIQDIDAVTAQFELLRTA
ncbi:protein kinase [Achlya hypogyna]|uniref:Protein kinase n=1 Tax=Achlya hypogyna TaxID=1202772 RepID=A0A1V9YGP7_ACHHY|nr:protein kinase [Achlya hypogyna]